MKLIIEMEMPKACRWYEDGTTELCPIAGFGGGGTACSITKLFEPFDDKRPSWCPIKGVLPDEHGDLIDRDVMQEKAFQMNFHGRISERELFLFNRSLSEMPIVIAAERRSDEQD